MPATTSRVGGLELPLAATGPGDALVDPVVDMLLAFVGHILTEDIDPKLADLGGTGPEASPAAARFGVDPHGPRTKTVKIPAPSLWIWWDGQSTIVPHTQLYSYRKRELRLLYVFPELPAEAETDRRRGLMAAVDACLARWFRFGAHPTFTYGGKPARQPIEAFAGASLNQLSIDYLGGRGLPRVGVDEPNERTLGRKVSGRDYPGYAGLIEIHERIDWLEPDDINRDHTFAARHDGSDPLLDRNVPAALPDNDPDEP